MPRSGHSIVRYSVGNCSLGSVVVAASGRGVCAICLGDHPDALVRELLDRFAPSALVRDEKALASTLERIAANENADQNVRDAARRALTQL